MFLPAPLVFLQSPAIEDVKFRVEAMVMRDQEARVYWIGQMKSGKPDPAAVHELGVIDREDTAEMKKIVDRYGWPTISRFGKDCASKAWLLVQHADQDPSFQQRCLDLMKPLIRAREVSPQNYAYLADRVSVKKTGKQLYGTQCKIENGKVILNPVIDRKGLDARRKEMGMMPIAQYLKLVREMYLPKG